MEFLEKNLPEGLREKGLAETLVNICRKNDVVFLAVFGSFVRGHNKRLKAMLILQLNMPKVNQKLFWICCN